MRGILRELKQLGVSAVLYTALAASANASDWTALESLRDGDMIKLTFASSPVAPSEAEFITFEGAPLNLSDYAGKVVLLNFWATWCGPCKKEMPMLSELQTEFGGDDFEVITIATGRNRPPAMTRFFASINVDNLPLHRDPKSALAGDMNVFGLPTTLILDRDGHEIARLTGDADWSSDSAKAILRAVIDR